MTAVLDGVARPEARTLALTLLHFVWQGALVAGLLAAANLLLVKASARTRYAAACGALLAMLAMPLATAWTLGQPSRPAVTDASFERPAGASLAEGTPSARGPARSDEALTRSAPWIVLAWLAGVGLLSVRAAGGWVVAGRVARRQTRPAPPLWESRVRELAVRLSIRQPVRLLESLRVEVPSAIGALRPVILLPAGIATGMTTEQLDALLAHELAHVRRRDYLVNLLQVAAETLLFYHPAVWWVSHRIRVERENACDDLAVEATGDASRYARALVALEEKRPARFASGLAVALFGTRDGRGLGDRVRRLFPRAESSSARSTPRPLAALVALGGALAAGASSVVVPAHLGNSPSQFATAPTPAPPAVAPAAPTPRSARPPGTAAKPKRANGGRLTPDQLVAFRIHGVTPEFIDAIEALGFTRLTADDLIALRVHDVSPDEIRQMKELFGNVSLDDCVAFKVHGVTPGLVRELRSLGFPALSADDAVAFRIHDVTPQYVKEIRSLGYANIDADELVAFRVHGVTPAYIRSINESAGGRLSADDVIETRIYGKEDEEENP
jgi:beta-lactamase regulating signal transducer with metallopeptidase domain